MAGHSKWANIKHRKANQDAKRGKIFTKLIRELTVAAKSGGADLSANSRLRTAIDKALSNNMKRDTIDKAIARGTGQLEGVNYEEIRYEGYGIDGVAILVDCLTDNKQRTVSDVRHTFSKHGGNLGTAGSVAYLFEHQGIIHFSDRANEEAILDFALDHDASDISDLDEDGFDIITEPQNYLSLKEALIAQGYEPEYAELIWKASVPSTLSEEQAEKVIKLIDTLEDLDDVQMVYTNMEIQ